MRKVLIGILAILFIVGGNLYHSQLGFAGNLYPLNGNEITLTDYSNGEETGFLIKINENGTFYKEVVYGSDEGSFEAWDGEKFYRYNKEYNDLLIVNNPNDGSKVIAHPFLSEVVNNRIVEDISKNKLKRNFLSKEYRKIEKNEQEVIETIVFDKQNKYPQEYQMYVNDEKTSGFEITKLSGLEEELNIRQAINFDKLLKNNVEITEVEATN